MINKVAPYLKENKFLITAYRKYKRIRNSMRYKKNKLIKKPITEDILTENFKYCGIYPGDKIVVTSSLSSIGYVQGGADTFVRALKNYITKEGLIVMPSYPHRGMYDYLESYILFDVNETPSQNGIITELFRKGEKVYRSLHPTHPLCFWGNKAEELSLDHEKTKSPYDSKSPYKKLLDMDVKNFCIGVDFEHMIMIRIIDDLLEGYAAHMYFNSKKYIVPVKNKNGQIIKVETRCHDPKKTALRHNMKLYKYMKKDIINGKLGNAKTIVISSKAMFEHQVKLAKKGIFPYYSVKFINLER